MVKHSRLLTQERKAKTAKHLKKDEGDSLQNRVDICLSGNSTTKCLNQLVIDLADAAETSALIRIWDVLGGSKKASADAWRAVERLHSRGKGKIPRGSLHLPATSHRTLNPARRLHKICKGKRMSKRSEKAEAHINAGIAWVKTQRATGRQIDASTGKKRGKVIKELRKALQIDKETARGLVTKLKRKKIL